MVYGGLNFPGGFGFHPLSDRWARIKIGIHGIFIKEGGGVTLIFFVKLDFKIAVIQLTRARDKAFEGVPDTECPLVPAGQPRPYSVNFCQITLTCSKPCFGVLYL